METGAQLTSARTLVDLCGAAVVGTAVAIDEAPEAFHRRVGPIRSLLRLG